MKTVSETELTWISPETQIDGKITVHGQSRIHGSIRGDIRGLKGSSVTLMEGGRMEGRFSGPEIRIAGYFKGEIQADERAVLTSSARFVGTIKASKIEVHFGAFVEGDLQVSAPADV